MESLQGKFLIATPQMPDPRFQEQVIFICSHSEDEGAMGLVVNYPSAYSMLDIFKSANLSVEQEEWPPIYIGGPVEVETAFFLYTSDYSSTNFISVTDTVCISRDPQILHDIAKGVGPQNFLFMLGYAGWAPGQLESELTLNGWLTIPAEQSILFQTPDSQKWKRAAEHFGIDIALFSDEIGSA